MILFSRGATKNERKMPKIVDVGLYLYKIRIAFN